MTSLLELSLTEQKYISSSITLFDTILPTQKISVIIPCYNEAATIGEVIRKIENLNWPNYEIIIVDDGSTDNTYTIVNTFEKTKIVSHGKNQGYGKTILDGISAASGDFIITLDSDGQHDPSDIPTLCIPILKGEADIVIGSRYLGEYYYNIPFLNRAGEAFIEIMLKLLFGQTIKNNQSGFRVFHRNAKKVFEDASFDGMAYTTEILILSFLQGFHVVEQPIHLHYRPIGKSRVKKLKLLFELLVCLISYFTKSKIGSLFCKKSS